MACFSNWGFDGTNFFSLRPLKINSIGEPKNP
jgi:hypothetical protein